MSSSTIEPELTPENTEKLVQFQVSILMNVPIVIK